VSGLFDGGFVVCWQSDDGSGNGIFGQLYKNNGTKSGVEFRVNTYTSDYQDSPAVSFLTGGGFMVCWRSYGQDGDWDGIFGQLYNSDGIKQGDEFQVNTYTSSSQSNPSVSGLSDGGFVVCWQSLGQDGDGAGIFGQVYDNGGSKIGPEFQVNTNTSGFQGYPCVSVSSGGSFVVCWQGEDEDADGIFGQIYDSTGIKHGEEFHVNIYTSGTQSFPSVCGLSDSGFVLSWQSNGQDGDAWGIFGQMYDSNGIKRSDEFQVNTYTSSSQSNPTISNLSDGGFVVCWESSYQDGDDWGIFGQLYNSDGIKQGDEFQVNTYTSRMQNFSSTASLSNGEFVVCWQSFGQDRGRYNIYGKYYLGTPILHLLQSFSLIFPAYDAILYSTTVNFLDVTEDFSNPEIFSDIYDSTFSVKNLSPGQTYFWKVLAKTYEGDSLWSSETFGFYVSPAAGIEDDLVLKPETFKLYPNYPNPFNPETTIRYSLPADQSAYRVIIKIYDVLGQLVKILKDEQQRPGLYHLIWNGRNAAGQAVPSGVYFCVLDAGSFRATQKMLLVR
jgi:hypothetical protein